MIWEESLERRTYVERRVPEFARSLENYEPPMPPPDGKAFVVHYPLDGLIGSVLSELIYPHGLAQAMNPDKVDIVEADVVAGRDTIVLLRQAIDSKGALFKKHKYWIDAKTGVMLKQEGYAETTGWNKWVQQTAFINIAYDRPIPSEKFTFLPAPGVKQVTPEIPPLNSRKCEMVLNYAVWNFQSPTCSARPKAPNGFCDIFIRRG
jgi:hypothetical protein